MKRNLLLILSLWSVLTGLQAQKLAVEGMTASPMDLSASQYERKDLAGQACGLVKVQLADEGAQFEGNVFGKVEYKTGEYWVYMTQGAYMLRVKHPKFVPLDVNFHDYGISGVESKVTYTLTLLMGEKTQKLIIDYTPKDALVLVDSKPYQENGHLELTLPIGSYDYVIAKKGYATIEGVAKLNKDTPRRIVETLQLEKSSEIVQVPVKLQDSQTPIANKQEQPVTQPISQTESSVVNQSNIETITVGSVSFNMIRVEGGTFTMGYNMFESLELSSRMEEANVIVQKLDYLRDYITNPANKYNTIPSTFIPSIVEQTKSSLINSYNQAVNDHNRLIKNVNEQTPQAQALSVKIDELQDSLRGALLQLRRSADVNRQMIQEMFMKYKNDEKMGNQVTLSDYWIGETEVTQELWMAVMGNNPSHFLGPKLPVEHVSMLDCLIFIDKLNHLTGKKFRLPTEAEWEYAAKGSRKSNNYLYSGSNNFNDVAWYLGNSGSTTHDVGQKAHNELGLYDMSGNVYEWCWFQNQDEDTPVGMGSMGVGRGGCWVDKLEDCRVSARSSFPSDLSCNLIGLRLAL